VVSDETRPTPAWPVVTEKRHDIGVPIHGSLLEHARDGGVLIDAGIGDARASSAPGVRSRDHAADPRR
jgi:hypothetical protein